MLGDHQKSIIRFYTIQFRKVCFLLQSRKRKEKNEEEEKNGELSLGCSY